MQKQIEAALKNKDDVLIRNEELLGKCDDLNRNLAKA